MLNTICRLCGLCLLLIVTASTVAAGERVRLAQTPPLLRAPMNNDVVVPPAIIVPEQNPTPSEVLPLPPQPAPQFSPPPGDEQYQPPLAAPPVYRVPQPNDPPPVLMSPGEIPAEGVAQCSSGKAVKIAYRHWGRKPLRECAPVAPAMLCVTNPCTGCDLQVPVCLPLCCDCEPKVHARKALFSESLVSFEWAKGVKVVVRFERSGKVIVTYHGV
ncbi:MAG: hypothetical protein JNM18_02345 [Planctomycetaceae bacterium]|nr:hypothetical protein [Planctomycetaceae bacterium]